MSYLLSIKFRDGSLLEVFCKEQFEERHWIGIDSNPDVLCAVCRKVAV
jgi:hypothetical protein